MKPTVSFALVGFEPGPSRRWKRASEFLPLRRRGKVPGTFQGKVLRARCLALSEVGLSKGLRAGDRSPGGLGSRKGGHQRPGLPRVVKVARPVGCREAQAGGRVPRLERARGVGRRRWQLTEQRRRGRRCPLSLQAFSLAVDRSGRAQEDQLGVPFLASDNRINRRMSVRSGEPPEQNKRLRV